MFVAICSYLITYWRLVPNHVEQTVMPVTLVNKLTAILFCGKFLFSYKTNINIIILKLKCDGS
jgi:hypothetical protein